MGTQNTTSLNICGEQVKVFKCHTIGLLIMLIAILCKCKCDKIYYYHKHANTKLLIKLYM